MGIRSTKALRAAPLAQLLARFAPHVRIAHHIPGRVRLRLDVAALKNAGAPASAMPLKGAWTDDGTLPGVQRVSWNLLAHSCTIEYDAARIAPAAWPDLLAGRDTPPASALRALLQQAQQRAVTPESHEFPEAAP